MSHHHEELVPEPVAQEVARDLGVRFRAASGVIITENIALEEINVACTVTTVNKPVKTRYRAQYEGDTSHLEEQTL